MAKIHNYKHDEALREGASSGGYLTGNGALKFRLLSATDVEDGTGLYIRIQGTTISGSVSREGAELDFRLYYAKQNAGEFETKFANGRFRDMVLSLTQPGSNQPVITDAQLLAYTKEQGFDPESMLKGYIEAFGQRNQYAEACAFGWAGDQNLKKGDSYKYDTHLPIYPSEFELLLQGDESVIPQRPNKYIKPGSEADVAEQTGQTGHFSVGPSTTPSPAMTNGAPMPSAAPTPPVATAPGLPPGMANFLPQA